LRLPKSREILRYGSWLVLVSGLDFLNWRMDYVLIEHGLGAKALGAYNVGQTLTNTATGDVVSSLGRALFSAFCCLTSLGWRPPLRRDAGMTRLCELAQFCRRCCNAIFYGL